MWVPFVIEAIVVAILTVVVYRYFASFTKHPPYVPILVLLGWYLCFWIVFLVPIDISSAWYDNCLRTAENKDECDPPIQYISSDTLLIIWRVIYWTMYILCWTIYPTMEAYSLSGGFSILEKLRIALVANLIFYGLIGFVLLIALIYIAAANNLNGHGMLGVAIAAANSWGLLLVILFSGFGMVEVPRKTWRRSSHKTMLQYYQSQVVHLHEEMIQAETELDEILKLVHKVASEIPENDPWRKHIDTIIAMCPEDYREVYYGEGDMEPTYDNLVLLSKKVRHAVNAVNRSRCLYYELVNSVFSLEDVLQAKSQGLSGEKRIKWSFKKPRVSRAAVILKLDFFEWLWKCWLQEWVLKLAALITFAMSITLLWSEVTIASRTDPDPLKPEGPGNEGSGTDLSVWSLLIHMDGLTEFSRQIIVFIPMLYLAICVYYGLFRFRFFNIYRLLPHQQTDTATLLFCALYLGRLTAPLAFNFVTMIHNRRTAFFRMMGNMAVVPVIGTSLNTYLPIALAVVVLMTLFNLFSKISDLLHLRRFQFEGSDGSQLEEGMELLKTERMKKERQVLTDSLPSQPLKQSSPRGPTFVRRGAHSAEPEEIEPEIRKASELKEKPISGRDRLKERVERAKERGRARFLGEEVDDVYPVGGKDREKEKERGGRTRTSRSSLFPSATPPPPSSSTSSLTSRLYSFFGKKSADNSLNAFVDDIESTASRVSRARNEEL